MRNESGRLGGGEIDLLELLGGVWQKKWIVVLTSVVFAIVASVYAYSVAPTYEAKIFIQPPTENDIAQLNYGRGAKYGLEAFKIKDVYAVYTRNLQSESLRREFFRKYYLPSLSEDKRGGSQDVLYRKFSEVLTLGLSAKENPDRFYVMSTLADPKRAAEWVVLYSEMAGSNARDELITDAQGVAVARARNLEQFIDAARESARKQREDRIVRLSEALQVARAIKLENPPIISNGLNGEVSAEMGGQLTYMRGVKALQAEIEILQNRKSDDPFINDLRGRQEEVTFLRQLKIDSSAVQVYRQDGAIELPDAPVQPKKLAIIVLGLLFGVAVGVALALFAYRRSARH